MASSNGNNFRVADPLCGEFTGDFPAQWLVTRSSDVFFDMEPIVLYIYMKICYAIYSSHMMKEKIETSLCIQD